MRPSETERAGGVACSERGAEAGDIGEGGGAGGGMGDSGREGGSEEEGSSASLQAFFAALVSAAFLAARLRLES